MSPEYPGVRIKRVSVERGFTVIELMRKYVFGLSRTEPESGQKHITPANTNSIVMLIRQDIRCVHTKDSSALEAQLKVRST